MSELSDWFDKYEPLPYDELKAKMIKAMKEMVWQPPVKNSDKYWCPKCKIIFSTIFCDMETGRPYCYECDGDLELFIDEPYLEPELGGES